VHEYVAAEDERVRVDLCDYTTAAGTDMGKDALSFGVFAKRLEVEVIDGRGLRFVECWPWAVTVLYVGRCGISVP
jgi:hypothetical protein